MRTVSIYMGKDTSILYQSIIDNYIGQYENLFSIDVEDEVIKINTLAKDDSIVIDFLSKKIVNHIINHYESNFIKEIVHNEFFELFDSEMDDIISRTEWILYNKGQKHHEQHVKKLENMIYETLDENSEFNYDGFIVFRLKERKDLISRFIDYVVNMFYEEQEDKEIIDFSKRILKLQNPKCKLLHVIIHDDTFYLVNEKYENIDMDDLRNLSYVESDEIDFLLGVLISFHPEKIILHTNDNQSPYLSSIITKVFENIEFCSNCFHCSLIREKNENS
mgnify:CR=1 FL=1